MSGNKNLAQNQPANACDFILFGTKGDLARTKILPSLYRLEQAGLLHPNTMIVGVGRADWGADAYKIFVKQALEEVLKEHFSSHVWASLAKRLDFLSGDVYDTHTFTALKKKIHGTKRIPISYFAMPPDTFGAVCEGLKHAAMNEHPARVVIEKPIGTSLDTFREISATLNQYFEEDQIYRIDHYLGKETVLNLLALRFANALFVNNWDNRSIEHVEITVAEETGIKGRWNYFNKTGQLRDMVQSHLLQILAIIAMSPPGNLDSVSIRAEKLKVLRALRPIDRFNVSEKVVRGQYTKGIIGEDSVAGYVDEKGADNSSQTETFVSVRVDIDNWRWSGVPFYLRTGKRMPVKASEIIIYFKKPALNIFRKSQENAPQNRLRIRLQPDEGMDLEILNKTPGLNHKHHLQSTKLDLSFRQSFNEGDIVDAYDRLLLECMRGIQALFLSRDEIEAAWEWVDTIQDAWTTNNEPLRPYQAGTWGPIASVGNISRDGYEWSEYL